MKWLCSHKFRVFHQRRGTEDSDKQQKFQKEQLFVFFLILNHFLCASALTEHSKPYHVRGQILVLPRYDASFEPLIAESLAVILQNSVDDKKSEKELVERCLALGKTVVTRVDGAFRILREGQLVTVDPEKALVYKGVVR